MVTDRYYPRQSRFCNFQGKEGALSMSEGRRVYGDGEKKQSANRIQPSSHRATDLHPPVRQQFEAANRPRREAPAAPRTAPAAAPRQEQTAPRQEQTAQRRPRKKKRGVTVLGVIGTLALVGVLTVAIFTWIFMRWVNTSLKGNVEVYIDEFENSVSTELYYQDQSSGDWVMYQTLFMEGEDRIWVSYDEIPKYLRDAAVAIEDHRFNEHKGVDWKGTIRAIVFTLGPGNSLQGGSTITQQLIKNLTQDSETTVKRKVTEIYRALEMETRYDKDEILEAYLNEIYLGRSCYGVEAASLRYFGKYVRELDLAECASLIAITNNPSRYGPLESDWSRRQNRGRQLDVLERMLEYGKISQAEYDKARNEEIVFTNGYTNLGNYVNEHLEEIKEEGEKEKPVSTAWNSYFTDALISDVARALVRELGLTENRYTDKDGIEHVTSAYEQAINMVYGNGYKIYTTQVMEYQKIAESVFEDVSNAPYTRSDGEQLQGAITVVDPYTGYVVALVGGIGPKTADRGWNWATSERPCGSAVKPISTYAPALDSGVITTASTVDDYPVLLLNDEEPYPKNDNGHFRGLTPIRTALVSSLNTCAVRVCLKYGVWNAYDFMTNKLGFTTLTAEDSQQVGNMALGGFQYGVTTEEMAAAYGAFVNEGIYTAPRTFVRVEDANGRVVLENEARSNVAMKPTTAAIMNSILQQVISGGTGYSARFSGMHIAGKTGTTNNLKDRYFVGYSPYYSAAVWVGYKSNSVVSSGGVNPAAVLWQKVMSQIHAELPDKDFFTSSGLTTVTVCADSGMLATTACEADPRGSRVVTEICASDNQPLEYCTYHDGSAVLNYVRDDEQFADFPEIVADDDDYVMHTKPMFVVPDPDDPSTWWDEFGNFIGGDVIPPENGQETDTETEPGVDLGDW